jgi:hypothetical protein
MLFSIRPYRRFPVHCAVTYNAGPFQGQGTVGTSTMSILYRRLKPRELRLLRGLETLKKGATWTVLTPWPRGCIHLTA